MTTADQPVSADIAALLDACTSTFQMLAEQEEGPYRRGDQPRRRDVTDGCDGSPFRLVLRLHVVDDGSSDATAELARASLSVAPANVVGHVLAQGCGSAGGARTVAFDRGIAAAGRPGTTWLASTDADTVVGTHWLAHHLRWARAGFDGVAGLVDVAWSPDQVQLAARFQASMQALGCQEGHAHVHGANLGLRASRWIEVGGCDERADGEDHDLWRRLRAAGARLHGATDLPVVTSSRLIGRVPAGFSGLLRSLGR